MIKKPKKSNTNNNNNIIAYDNNNEMNDSVIEESNDYSIVLTPTELYFQELNNNFSTALYLTPDRWILIRSHLQNKPAKLSGSHYWLINCNDPTMQSLHCSCKSFHCIHIAYIKSRLSTIVFPLQNIESVTNNQAYVAVIREMSDDNLSMRRILIVVESTNNHYNTAPVIVIQSNRLPSTNAFWCRHCFLSSCKHINSAIKYCEENHLPCTQYVSTRAPRSFHESISTKSIPKPRYLQTEEEILKSGAQSEDNPIRFDSTFNSSIILHEKRSRCDCATNFSLCQSQPCEVYAQEAIYNCSVASIQCNDCRTITPYDGLQDEIFNYNNKKLFTHSLLNYYTIECGAMSIPFNAFVLVIKRNYQQKKITQKFVSNPTFLIVWCSFVKLQDWSFKFECPQCGTNPEVLFCDGTSVSIQKIFAKNLRSPIHVESKTPLRADTYLKPIVTRYFSKEIRDIIKSFLEAAKLNECDKLDAIIANFKPNSQHPTLSAYFHLIRLQTTVANKTPFMMGRLRTSIRLLSVLAEDESLVALISPTVLQQYNNIMQFIKAGKAVPLTVSQLLKDCRPLLYEVLNSFHLVYFNNLNHNITYESVAKTDSGILINFLDSIMSRAAEIHRQYDELQNKAGPGLIPDQPDLTDSELLQSNSNLESAGKFYANRPIRSKIQRYHKIDSINVESDNKEGCQKKFPTKQKYSGGIMVFWCEHGVCQGFHMIESSEAQRDIMCAILMHWSVAPKVIVYDNACHLMNYCHNREWEFFKNTTFLIDEFHQYNHVGCSEAHSMKQYKSSRSIKFLFKNCSVAESGNAGLDKIKPSVHYMQADAAFLYTLIQLEIQNIVKSQPLRVTPNNIVSASEQDELQEDTTMDLLDEDPDTIEEDIE